MRDKNLQELFEAYQDKPIAYMPIYAKITGSVTSGILLSQIIYWDSVMDHAEFYKTDKEFSNDLSMGIDELAGAKSKLKKLGIIEIERKGQPAKTHYKLNIDVLIALITSYRKNRQLDIGKTDNLMSEKLTTNITETTTKTTTKTTLLPKKYSSLQDITDIDIKEIADRYKVTIGFVKLQKEKLENYCESFGRRYKNYKSALRNFVLGDIQKNIENRHYQNSKFQVTRV